VDFFVFKSKVFDLLVTLLCDVLHFLDLDFEVSFLIFKSAFVIFLGLNDVLKGLGNFDAF
jgi:hypothetical protein